MKKKEEEEEVEKKRILACIEIITTSEWCRCTVSKIRYYTIEII